MIPDKILRKSMAKSISKTQYAYDLMLMLEPLSEADIIEQIDIANGGFLKENKNVKYNFPLLILVGQDVKTGKVRKYCEECAKQENYPIYFIKDAAHFSNADNPVEVNNKISSFIKHNIQ